MAKSPKASTIIYQAIEKLGGLYVKLIQFICLRLDIFPENEKMRFLSFYDSVPPQPLDIHQFLIKELHQESSTNFVQIDHLPFASGTFGQVYKATLLNGSTVVLKVKRSNLENDLKADFMIVKITAFIFNLFYDQAFVDIGKFIKEFERVTYQELDYENEVENALYFYHHYEHNPNVVVPKTYPHLCTKNLIVQEYIGGIPLTDLIKLKHQGVDYHLWLRKNYSTDLRQFLENLAYELSLQGFVMDKFYADPHPGNIKVLTNNRVGIIDFGILDYSPKNKRNYYNIFDHISNQVDHMDTVALGKEFLKFGSNYFYNCLKTLDYYLSDSKTSLENMITENYQHLIQQHTEKYKLLEVEHKENFAQMLFDLLKVGQKFNVMVPPEVFSMLRLTALFKSYSLYLEPDFYCARRVYQRVLQTVDKDQLINEDDIVPQNLSIERAVEGFMDWAVKLAEVDTPLYHKLSRVMNQAH